MRFLIVSLWSQKQHFEMELRRCQAVETPHPSTEFVRWSSSSSFPPLHISIFFCPTRDYFLFLDDVSVVHGRRQWINLVFLEYLLRGEVVGMRCGRCNAWGHWCTLDKKLLHYNLNNQHKIGASSKTKYVTLSNINHIFLFILLILSIYNFTRYVYLYTWQMSYFMSIFPWLVRSRYNLN